MPRHAQYGYSNGEISPETYGRKEIEPFARSVKFLRNFVAKKTGALVNREGGEFAGMEALTFDATQPYLATASTAANPVEITVANHPFETGDRIYLTQFDVADELNSLEFIITKTGTNTFTVPVDGTGYGVATTGICQRVNPSMPVRSQAFDIPDESGFALYFGHEWVMPVRDGGHILDGNTSPDLPTTQLEVTAMTAAKPIKCTVNNDANWWRGHEVVFGEIPSGSGDFDRLSGNRYRISPVWYEAPNGVQATGVDFETTPSPNTIEINFTTTHGLGTGDKVWFCWDGAIDFGNTRLAEFLNGRVFMGEALDTNRLALTIDWGWFEFDDDWDEIGLATADTGIIPMFAPLDEFYLDETDGSAYSGALSGNVDINKIVRFKTSYVGDDVMSLNFAQDDLVMSIACPSCPSSTLTYVDDVTWQFAKDTFFPSVLPPASIAPAAGTARRIAVTVVESGSGDESLPRYDGTAASASNSVVVTPESGAEIFEYNIYASEVDKKKLGYLTTVDVDSFDIDTLTAGIIDFSRRPPRYRNPFTTRESFGATIDHKDSTSPIIFSGKDGDYWVDRNLEVFFELITGQTELNGRILACSALLSGGAGTRQVTILHEDDASMGTFIDDEAGRMYRYTQTIFPRGVNYYGQRKVLAAGQKIYCCQTGGATLFKESVPLLSTDAFEFDIAEAQSSILHLIGRKHLLAFTRGGVFVISDETGTSLTPGAVQVERDYVGDIADIEPILIDDRVVFFTESGPTMRDLSYDGFTRTYKGADLSLFASHMLDGQTFMDSTHTSAPESIIWVVRADGDMLGVSYSPTHNINAWHQHFTQYGNYESVTKVREAGEDVRYDTVERTLPVHNKTRRTFERRKRRRLLGDIRKGFLVDAGVRVDDPQVATPFAEDPLRISTPNATVNWSVSDRIDIEHWVFKQGRRVEGNHHKKQYEVKSATGMTEIILRAVGAGADIDGTDILDDDLLEFKIRIATNTIERGLQHLAGETVDVFANGIYHPALTVSALGVLTLPASARASQWSIGFKYNCYVETFGPEPLDGESLIGQTQNVKGVVLLMNDSTKGKIGPDLARLRQLEKATDADFENELKMFSEAQRLDIQSARNDGGFHYSHEEPTPIEILASVVIYD